MVKSSDGSVVLDKEEVAVVRAALRFALDMSDTYYAFSPKKQGKKRDYSDGDVALCLKMERAAKKLLKESS